jgi:hypothetical protein
LHLDDVIHNREEPPGMDEALAVLRRLHKIRRAAAKARRDPEGPEPDLAAEVPVRRGRVPDSGAAESVSVPRSPGC